MMLSLTQIILLVFLVFALSRVFLRFKGGILSITGFIFWTGLFALAIITVLLPKLTTDIAKAAGIGRGVDIVTYASLVLIFYLIFRLHIYIEDLRNDITTLVRKIAMQEYEKKNADKSSKN